VATSYGVLSTYPPTQCGLATFSQALLQSLQSATDEVGVVRVLDAEEIASVTSEHPWIRTDPHGAESAATALNHYDVAILQHEYGIFPGPDGDEVLTVTRALRVPTITVLHTVLVTPSPHQREILEELVAQASVVVTMTETARQRLIAHYEVDPGIVQVIPHGADAPPLLRRQRRRSAGREPIVLTWGLLGEGKGIEWAIDAMGQLDDLHPHPQYWVVGQTHPKVRARQGEVYRDRLIERAATAARGSVHFDDRYLTSAELHQRVQQADVVLLPYDSREQVTSGVLIEAVTAGKPVISTGFPHAVELLSSGAGLIVERQDPTSIADALRRVLTEPGLAKSMAREAQRIAPELLWPAVADRYRRVARQAQRSDAFMASA